MSIAINPDKVTHILLADYTADNLDSGWWKVEPETLYFDSYEFVYPPETPNGEYDIVHGGGQSGVCATGFSFRPEGGDGWLSGPLTSIIAVRHKR